MENTDTFFKAIRNGDHAAVQKMLIVKPDLVNAKDERGSTPLILATYYDQEEITDLLLNYGAKIDAVDASENTALMGVCFKGFAPIAKNIIERGSNVNQRNAMGASCLILH